MDIDFYIFNWPRAIHAKQLQNDLTGLGRVTVINSGPTTNEGWVALDEQAYFSAQWNEAIRRFKGDILFHIQADAYSEHMKEIVGRALELRKKYDWGVFGPNVDFTDHVAKSAQLDLMVWEVPHTDCTCWAITREVLEVAPAWFPGKLGWEVEPAYVDISRAMNKKVIRDYTYTVQHPQCRGYRSDEAQLEWNSTIPLIQDYISKIANGNKPQRISFKECQ